MNYLYHFTGAGNNFVVLDGRGADMAAYRNAAGVRALCSRYHTDGLMILETDPELDFSMEFYNPDGSGGMMCGNGGRCIVAFADYLGIPSRDGIYRFRAPDGPHEAELLARPSFTEEKPADCSAGPENTCWIVKLQMKDVQGITPTLDGYFLDTGTRHYVQFVDGLDTLDIESVAKPIRWNEAFAPIGTNVNLVEATPDGLHVRTYEKGVEGETLACGTGITASAIAAWFAGIPPAGRGEEGAADRPAPEENYRLQCRRGDWLEVSFHPLGPESLTEVFLTGPAELLRITEIPQD